VEAPSAAGQKYFGRFVRWALREFLAESKSTVDLAKNVPGRAEKIYLCEPGDGMVSYEL